MGGSFIPFDGFRMGGECRLSLSGFGVIFLLFFSLFLSLPCFFIVKKLSQGFSI